MSAPTGLAATKDRIALARGIKAEQVVDHGWSRGMVTWRTGTDELTVTGRVAEFRLAKLLEPPAADGVKPPYVVKLNPAGRAWLAEHTGMCVRCLTSAATGECCSSHGKKLCHACYRRTHFSELCVAGCPLCAAEGLPVRLAEHGGAS